MTLIFASEVEEGIAIGTDADDPKAGCSVVCQKAVPVADVVLAWTGTFHRPPVRMAARECAEYLDPELFRRLPTFHERVKLVRDHLNATEDLHGGAAQAVLLVLGFDNGRARCIGLEATGGKGSWAERYTTDPPLAAGCLTSIGVSDTAVASYSLVGDTYEQFKVAAIIAITNAHRLDPGVVGPAVCFELLPR